MTHKLPTKKSPSRKAVLFAGGAFVLAALISTLVLNTQGKDGFLVYGDNEAQGLSATLKTAQGTQNLQQKDGRFSLPESLKKTFSAPYRISFFVPTQNGEQREFVWSVSQDKKQLTVSLDGFSADDTVSLAFGDDRAFKDVPMDWSGRNELTAALDGNDSIKACIEINGAAPALLCHVIPQGSKA